MATNDELLFIRDVLWSHGEYMWKLFQEQIDKKELKQSGELKDSIKYKLTKTGDNPTLSFSFLSYGRAIEIRNNSSNTKKFLAPSTNQIVWGIKNTPQKIKRKDTKWYARTAYGSLNTLIGRLMTEFSQEEINRIKSQLQTATK